MNRLSNPAILAQLGVALFGLGMLLLHVLPSPMLYSTTSQLIPYDWHLNFISEYSRTQYGPLMTFNFFMLSLASFAASAAMRRCALLREANFLALAGISLFLLAVFPSDLTDLRVDGPNCADATRVEPCTLSGRIHNPSSVVGFGAVALVWLSLAWRRKREMKEVVKAGVHCFALLLLLVGCCFLYASHMPDFHRYWFGMIQRSIVFVCLLWLWFLFGRASQLLAETQSSGFASQSAG